MNALEGFYSKSHAQTARPPNDSLHHGASRRCGRSRELCGVEYADKPANRKRAVNVSFRGGGGCPFAHQPHHVRSMADRRQGTTFPEIWPTSRVCLGALLDAVSHGIATLPKVTSNDWPRMADFAKWATACESAYTSTGSFKAAYQRNLVEATELLLDDDLVAAAVQQLKLPWDGPARKMLEELNSITGQAHVSAKDWPKEANALSARLRRLAPLLRSKGINAEKLQRTGAKRGWRLAPISAEEGKADLPSSSSSEPKVKGNDDRDISDDQFAGFSGRPHTTHVLPDIDAAYEELRIRDDAAGPPARQRERKRIHLRPR